MAKLPITFKKKWVEALRSGKYQQVKGYLRRGSGFCCLGVACDVYNRGAWKESTYEDEFTGEIHVNAGDWVTSSGSEELPSAKDLPPEVFEALESTHPLTDESYMQWLAGRNDAGVSFEHIADLIEEHL